MCVNKLYIRNNKLEFDPFLDRVYNYVCCGQCEDCLSLRRLDYQTRATEEFELTKSLGFTSIFFTLTYNDDFLPRFCGVPCFSKKHIQNFMKRLRKRFVKLGFDSKFRYFITSEYGHEKTDNYRPHYHVIFFFRNKFDPFYINDLIAECWNKGFVKLGSENFGVITDSRPFAYCVKYLQKDKDVDDYLNSVYTREDLELYYNNKENLPVDILPFHLQSKGFGMSLCDKLTDDDLINGYFVRTDSLGISKKYPVPNYIKRKLCYDFYTNKNGNVSYRLNDRGFKIFVPSTLRQIECLSQTYEDLVLKFPQFYNENKGIFQKVFVSVDACNKFVTEFLHQDYSVRLASYVVLYNQRSFYPWTYHNIISDINILKCCLKNPYTSIIDGHKHEYPFEVEDNILLKLFDCVSCHVKYELYIKNVTEYNTRQQFLGFRTGKYKYITPKSFNSFVNQKFKNLCLTMLLRRDKSLTKENLHEDSVIDYS